MKSCCCLALLGWTLSGTALGQQAAPPGLLRGELVQFHGGPVSGAFDVRSESSSQVYRCQFDTRTYMERDAHRIGIGAIQPGDRLEVLTDRGSGTACYARTVRVVQLTGGVVNPGYRVNLRSPGRTSFDAAFPRGNLTFAGVVLRLNTEMMVLRTRSEGERIVLLRDDTRYMADGLLADHPSLAVNTRVFVRAGRSLSDEIEAYQIVWGEIAGPKP